MCVIIVKSTEQKIPAKSILSQCWDSNPDGAGIALTSGDKVLILKGLMTKTDFLAACREIPKKSTALIHCRIGTSGYLDSGATHPFPISSKINEMTASYIKTDAAVCHNGIIPWLSYHHKYSDTQLFCRDYLSQFTTEQLQSSTVLGLIHQAIGTGNKLAFLFPHKFQLLGKFAELKGCFYSNLNFLFSQFSQKEKNEEDYQLVDLPPYNYLD